MKTTSLFVEVNLCMLTLPRTSIGGCMMHWVQPFRSVIAEKIIWQSYLNASRKRIDGNSSVMETGDLTLTKAEMVSDVAAKCVMWNRWKLQQQIPYKISQGRIKLKIHKCS